MARIVEIEQRRRVHDAISWAGPPSSVERSPPGPSSSATSLTAGEKLHQTLGFDSTLPFFYVEAVGSAVSETSFILHLRFTARDGGSGFANTVATSVKSKLNAIALAESRKGLYRLFSARHDYAAGWAAFFGPAPSTDQTLTLDTAPERFPFFTKAWRSMRQASM